MLAHREGGRVKFLNIFAYLLYGWYHRKVSKYTNVPPQSNQINNLFVHSFLLFYLLSCNVVWVAPTEFLHFSKDSQPIKFDKILHLLLFAFFSMELLQKTHKQLKLVEKIFGYLVAHHD